MSITTISDNERRLIGEAQVLRALLAEAVEVISVCAGDDDTEAGLLDQLETKIRAALRQADEFMPNHPLAPVAPAQEATKDVAITEPYKRWLEKMETS